jgi:hypothetical protein
VQAEQAGQLAAPSLDLDEPGTIEFTAERALAGRALNRFALSLRSPALRAEFLADEAPITSTTWCPSRSASTCGSAGPRPPS